ncbi:hypothetical protein NDU88_007436 [Pleurodeles waltl]|uniref:Uncharacterized protein n=1 Tax=Pleurodeles waltl TaxID=8319 RepID=A0AAV7RUT7_PLEWA|nr:hypothetical protein NDU88_007436 [Pleurodeles waltl]
MTLLRHQRKRSGDAVQNRNASPVRRALRNALTGWGELPNRTRDGARAAQYETNGNTGGVEKAQNRNVCNAVCLYREPAHVFDKRHAEVIKLAK